MQPRWKQYRRWSLVLALVAAGLTGCGGTGPKALPPERGVPRPTPLEGDLVSFTASSGNVSIGEEYRFVVHTNCQEISIDFDQSFWEPNEDSDLDRISQGGGDAGVVEGTITLDDDDSATFQWAGGTVELMRAGEQLVAPACL